MSIFSAREYQRYSRHIQLAQIGAAGQARLKQASVLLVGCGGLGAPVGLYLAGAGVGRITLVDGDDVELGNLQRQIAFTENEIGSNKARCLQARMHSLNSDIEVHAVAAMLSPDNADSLIEGKQLIVDCSDDFNVRCVLNRACIAGETAWIYASVIRLSGQCALFLPGGPCFSCLFPDVPQHAEDCNSAGVLASMPGLLGTLQASIALQFLAGETCFDGEELTLVEAAPLQLQSLRMRKRPDCETCGNEPATKPLNRTPATAVTCAAGTDYVTPDIISCASLQTLLDEQTPHLIDVRSNAEHRAFNIGGSNIPLEQIGARLPELQANKTLVLYCQSGQRSAEACRMLAEQDIAAKSLDGGLQAWLKCYAHLDG